MNFKQARKVAREKYGAYIGVFKQKEQGWFVQDTRFGYFTVDSRAVFYVNPDGSLETVDSAFARNYQKKYFANMQKKLDKWRPKWYNQYIK